MAEIKNGKVLTSALKNNMKKFTIIIVGIISLGLGYYIGIIKNSVAEKFTLIDNLSDSLNTSTPLNKLTSKDFFVDRILDATIQTSTGELIELPNLYDTLAKSLPEDKDEELILVQKLKRRGFDVTHWGRGNYPPLGPRIVMVELKKDKCNCSVIKKYYSTISDSLYQMIEGISCENLIDYQKK
jgi:hypothetical protein